MPVNIRPPLPQLRCGRCGLPVRQVKKSGYPASWAHSVTLRELGEVCYAIAAPMNHPAQPLGPADRAEVQYQEWH